MKIWLFTLLWNEIAMLDFFFRHYDSWIDRYFIYDDGSDDGTTELLRARADVEVRRQPHAVPDSMALSHQRLQKGFWKEARGKADLVVVTDIDEHLYHPNMVEYLRANHARGVTMFPALGFDMVSDTFPESNEHLARSRIRGVPWKSMNKLGIFDPNAIRETNFSVGRHKANPSGLVRVPDHDEIMNLHYKTMGLDYFDSRNSLLRKRLGATDRARNFGYQYHHDRATREAKLRGMLDRAIDVTDPGLDTDIHHTTRRWWRDRRSPGEIERCRVALRHNPLLLDLRIQLALALVATREIDEAERIVTEGLELAPNEFRLWGVRAHILGQRNRYPAAIEAARRSTELGPENPMTHFQLSLFLQKERRHAEALESMSQAIALSASTPRFHYRQSLILADLHRSEEAIDAARQATRLSPDDQRFRKHIVKLLHQQKTR